MHERCSPVVFIPGIFGSELRRGNDVVWGDVRTPLRDLQRLALPGPTTQATQVIESVIVFRRDIVYYGSILKYLRSGLGYTDDEDLFLFPYDWRQDCAQIAAHLKDFLRHCYARVNARRGTDTKLVLVAHSMGGLIARYCTQVLRGDRFVKSIIAMGTPHLGCPSALEAYFKGADVFPLRFRRHATIPPLRTFPSAYQLLPQKGFFVRDDQDNAVNLFDARNRDWLKSRREGRLLDMAARFLRRLDEAPQRVPIYSIFGYGQKTLMFIDVASLGAGRPGRWERARYRWNTRGDGRVPERSAIFDPNRNLPVAQKHPTLFNRASAIRYFENLLCNDVPDYVPPVPTAGASIFVDLDASVYIRGSIAYLVLGVLDSANRIITGATFKITIRTEDAPADEPPAGEIDFRDPNPDNIPRLGQTQFVIPAQFGSYTLEVSAQLPNGPALDPVADFFVVL
jgi:phospholipase A1